MPRIRIRCLLLTGLVIASPAVGAGLPLEGSEAEAFLRDAVVTDRENLGIGVTRSKRLTLEAGELSARAMWKTIDDFEAKKRFDDGRWEAGFVDSYKNEIAGYELDKLIGLGLVPPTVERELGAERGAIQLWVEGAMMETERMENGLSPENIQSWNDQILKVRLFHNLTFNTDFNNARNVLSDSDGRIYLIDHSRAFRTHKRLNYKSGLTRFSRSLLEGLRGLDRKILEDKLGRWLTKRQILGLLARRDLILELAKERVAEHGESQVLYP